MKISILVKFSGNLNFGQNFRKSWFRSKNLGILDISSILILARIFKISIFFNNCRKLSRFCQNFSKILILVIIYKILDFGQNFRKCWLWLKLSENLDFSQDFRKYRCFQNFHQIMISLKKIIEKSWFGSKLSKNLHISPNLWKISMLVSIFAKSQFWSKCLKISILLKKFLEF